MPRKTKPATEEPTALATTGPAALAVPDYITGGGPAGSENIGVQDITLPRLALAQALSPQVDPDNDLYIDGLRNGDMFNSLTSTSYGRGPVPVVIVRVEAPRWIEFDPKDRSVIVDRDIPEGDPRTTWDGNTPPAATEFRDYLALHAETGEPIGLSFKGTSLRAAKDLNSLIKLYPNQVYNIGTAQKKNEKGSFYIFKVTASSSYPAEPIYAEVQRLAKAWGAANVEVDATESADKAKDDMAEDTPF